MSVYYPMKRTTERERISEEREAKVGGKKRGAGSSGSLGIR